jgi:hypothetical protein
MRFAIEIDVLVFQTDKPVHGRSILYTAAEEHAAMARARPELLCAFWVGGTIIEPRQNRRSRKAAIAGSATSPAEDRW